MGLVDLASGDSLWRGYDYYAAKHVTSHRKVSANEFEGTVAGSGNKQYEVHIDTEHPRRSTCNCPHAKGRRVICKHMVALYFTIFPDEANKLIAAAEAYEAEKEKRQDKLEDALIKYVGTLKKDELQQKLLELLFNGSALCGRISRSIGSDFLFKVVYYASCKARTPFLLPTKDFSLY